MVSSMRHGRVRALVAVESPACAALFRHLARSAKSVALKAARTCSRIVTNSGKNVVRTKKGKSSTSNDFGRPQ